MLPKNEKEALEIFNKLEEEGCVHEACFNRAVVILLRYLMDKTKNNNQSAITPNEEEDE